MVLFGALNTVKSGASYMKVVITLTCIGESNSGHAQELYINNLVKVQFRWEVKAHKKDEPPEIAFKYSLSKCDSENNNTIATDIACEELKCFQTDLLAPRTWSKWKLMGTKKLIQKMTIDKLDAYHALIHVLITVHEPKMNRMPSILYTDTKFTDFKLSTEEGSVPVHRACLAGYSSVFRAMLMGEWKETSEGQVMIQGVTLQTLQQLKDYMYLGILPSNDDSLRPLLLTARCYLMEDLEKYCIRKLVETVTPERLLSLIDFACQNQIPELPFRLLQFTKDSVIAQADLIKQNNSN